MATSPYLIIRDSNSLFITLLKCFTDNLASPKLRNACNMGTRNLILNLYTFLVNTYLTLFQYTQTQNIHLCSSYKINIKHNIWGSSPRPTAQKNILLSLPSLSRSSLSTAGHSSITSSLRLSLLSLHRRSCSFASENKGSIMRKLVGYLYDQLHNSLIYLAKKH